MLLITPILIGIVIGAGMALLFGRPNLIPYSTVAGLIGALVLRLIVYSLYDSRIDPPLTFSWVGLLASIVGAALVSYGLMFVPGEKIEK